MAKKTQEEEVTKYWIHAESWIYQGDQVEGAREATSEEVAAHVQEVQENSGPE